MDCVSDGGEVFQPVIKPIDLAQEYNKGNYALNNRHKDEEAKAIRNPFRRSRGVSLSNNMEVEVGIEFISIFIYYLKA